MRNTPVVKAPVQPKKVRMVYIIIISFFGGLCLVALSSRVGYRDITIGADYFRYYNHYLQVQSGKSFVGRFELGYQLIELVGSYLNLKPEVFFATLAFLQMVSIIWAFWILAKMVFAERAKQQIVTLISISIMAFWFWWLLYLFFLRRYLFIFLALISAMYVFQLSDKVAIAIEHVLSIPIYTGVAMRYGADATYYKAGYRYDFFLFSMLPLIQLGVVRWLFLRATNTTRDLVALYGTLLIPFLLLGYGAYMDRWLLPAWIMMPLLIASVSTSVIKETPTLFFISSIVTIFA